MPVKAMVIRDTDRMFYEEHLAPWLPERILDCHVHVCLDRHFGAVSPERRREIWAIEAGISQSWGDLRASYSLLFPDQTVSALAFGGIYKEHDTHASNDYLLTGIQDEENRAHGLFVTRPDWDTELLVQAMANGFIGIKPYPDLATCDAHSVGIYDFLPRRHLEAVNQARGIVMMHLPRAGRLPDPDNVRELLEISNDYPDTTLIVAHIGRSFCLPTAKRGLGHFTDQSNIYFDTAANLNTDAIQFAIETVGPGRILFGSDMPITLMRGVREHRGDQYFNFTDGPYSWNSDRKSPEEEARYTFFIYEGLRALVQAALRSGCGPTALRGMLLENGESLLDRVSASVRASTRPDSSLHSPQVLAAAQGLMGSDI